MSTNSLHVHQPEAAGADSLSERATYAIRELIVTLELPPGSIVNERELMQRMGLGRTPVREALRTLAAEKLVDVFPRRGSFVSTIDAGDLASLSEVRLRLEGAAARLAAERATASDRSETASLIEELDATADERDERRLIGLDQRVHRHVYACTHNAYLEATLAEYYMLTLRIWFLALERVARLDQAVHEHRELLDAIARGDGEKAEAAMTRHIQRFEAAIRAVL